MSKNNSQLKIPTLDESVLAALGFFNSNPPALLKTSRFHFPLVIGSGNAYNTALALFGQRPAIIADESNFKEITKNYNRAIKSKLVDQSLIISASGEKDSIWEIKLAKKIGLKTTLLTCSPDSPAAHLADNVISYQKLPEPYTYNTSTYLGMILGASQEKPAKIERFIKTLKLPRGFKAYQAYSFLLPDKFQPLAEMIRIKKDELFGPHLSLRAFTKGEARHAKFVHPWNKELVISLGSNPYFGLKEHRWEIKTPRQIGPAFVMALTYYLIGLIQKSKEPYFKKHLAAFCIQGTKPYGQKKPFPIIVK